MGLRFRKSFKIAPGVRVNVGKKSIGISASVKGARVSVNSSGRKTTTVGIPGTGLSYQKTEKIGGAKKAQTGGFDDLPETDGVVAVSVGERYPAVFDWLKAHDVNAAVVIAVMVAVAFFNMASALLILVLERTRMIGLLKAMGMENRRIRRIFLYRAAFIVGRGLLWGNLAAGLLCWFQARFHLLRLDPAGYMLSEVPVAVSAGWWLAVDVAAAGAILALLLVPAAFVARIRPDEAIKTD